MSNKSIIGIVAVIVVLGGGVAIAHHRANVMTEKAATAANIAPAPTTAGTGMTQSSDTSDAALEKDMTSVDAQMNGLNSDNASADEGLSNPNQ